MLSFPSILSYSFWIEGISALHGGHQVAQQFIKTTFPFNSSVRTGFSSPCLIKEATILEFASVLGCSKLGLKRPIFIKPCWSNIRVLGNKTIKIKRAYIA